MLIKNHNEITTIHTLEKIKLKTMSMTTPNIAEDMDGVRKTSMMRMKNDTLLWKKVSLSFKKLNINQLTL